MTHEAQQQCCMGGILLTKGCYRAGAAPCPALWPPALQKVWESNYSLSELEVGPALGSSPRSPADTAPKTAPGKEIPALLLLQGTGDSLALGESGQVLWDGWSTGTG